MSWRDSDADSASLLTASATLELLASQPAKKVAREQLDHAMAPLALGAYTDTDGFGRPGASMTALRCYKHMVQEHVPGGNAAIEASRKYYIPVSALTMLGGSRRPRIDGEGTADLKRRIAELEANQLIVKTDYARDGSTALISCPREMSALALDLAHREDPEVNINDLRGHLVRLTDRLIRRWDLSVLLFEDNGEVLTSTRSSKPGPALDLAKAIAKELGGTGNGHHRMAGAKTPGELARVEAFVRKWLERYQLEREATQRAGRL
jgi:hypothetical protein